MRKPSGNTALAIVAEGKRPRRVTLTIPDFRASADLHQCLHTLTKDIEASRSSNTPHTELPTPEHIPGNQEPHFLVGDEEDYARQLYAYGDQWKL